MSKTSQFKSGTILPFSRCTIVLTTMQAEIQLLPNPSATITGTDGTMQIGVLNGKTPANMFQAVHENQHIAFCVYGIQFLLALLGIASVAAFLIFIRQRVPSPRHMITPKTLTLLLLGMSGTAYFIAHGFFFYSMSPSARVASNCLFVVYQAITLIYSWIRASEVFRRNVSNSVYMTFQCILCVGVAFMVVPLVLALLDNVGKEWTLLAIGISVCCVFALDLFYSYNYIRQIFEITLQIVDLKGMETRSILYFGIIARYGIVTSCLMLLGCGWFWAYVWFTRFPTRSVYLFAASVILMDLFLYLVGLSLFLMKARLVLLQESSIRS